MVRQDQHYLSMECIWVSRKKSELALRFQMLETQNDSSVIGELDQAQVKDAVSFGLVWFKMAES